MSQLFISSKKRNSGFGTKIRGCYYDNNQDSCFKEIECIEPISIKCMPDYQLLITLNVADTWCDKAGDGAWFAISVNDEIAARGLYICGINGQRVPITLQTAVFIDLPQKTIIKALWCNNGGTENRFCYIGEYSEAVLTVLEVDKGIAPME